MSSFDVVKNGLVPYRVRRVLEIPLQEAPDEVLLFGDAGPCSCTVKNSMRTPAPARHSRVLVLAYQGITYTTREKVIDRGPLKASVDKERSQEDRRRANTLTIAGRHAIDALCGQATPPGLGEAGPCRPRDRRPVPRGRCILLVLWMLGMVTSYTVGGGSISFW
jgi:hypothetical protein